VESPSPRGYDHNEPDLARELNCFGGLTRFHGPTGSVGLACPSHWQASLTRSLPLAAVLSFLQTISTIQAQTSRNLSLEVVVESCCG
jgi:hypothetical protein